MAKAFQRNRRSQFSRLSLILPEIKELLSEDKKDELKEIFYDYEPIEVAEALKEFSLKDKVTLFSLWDVDFAADVFEKMDKEDQLTLLGAVDEAHRGKILDELAPDERVDLFEQLPKEMVTRFLSIMEEEEAEDTRQLMTYESNTAGGRMTTDFACAKEEMSVEEALRNLRKTAKGLEMVYYVYVVNKEDKLVGVVSLKELILAEPGEKINEIMHTNLITIPVDMDQEQVARELAKYDFLALPVVDNSKRIKGIITVDDIIDVIKEENTEDMYKFGAAGGHTEEYISAKPSSIAKHRVTWLLILVVTGFISGGILENFSFALKRVIALSFFIPLLMDSAGNAGTQAATVMVRGLAVGEIRIGDIWRVARKELAVGTMLGIVLGALALARALVLQKSPLLGLTVGISMLATVTVSTCLGSILPLICKRLGADPAIVSGPLITTVVDITSLLIYFEIARYLLGLF